MELGIIFLTGLTIGGLTCLAVQGGLLASVIASREKEGITEKGKINPVFPTLAFLISKLIAYVILGFVLGLFGSAISLTSQIQSAIQIFAGIYMIIIALNLFDVHPIFRYFVIQPPRFLTRRIRNKSRSSDIFAPAILGFMTIFIPCGTTLAMEALAISSASPVKGALILGTFVLGTFPMFFGIGFLTAKLGDKFKDSFLKIAAVLLIFLGIISVYGGLVAMGVPISISKFTSSSSNQSSGNMSVAFPPIKNGFQDVSINVTSGGYDPSTLILKEGVPTKLTLITNDTYSCAIAFRIPFLKIGVNLNPTGSKVLDLPKLSKGNYSYTCSMGMYQGVMKVL
ncbi:MAG: sulfite exporter TauE/SafE family protein [Candidatus Levybacteria bacterium]|nr:sulfite exporter TauE/SafE family protein [Candidatus Levybacteria bacterium]